VSTPATRDGVVCARTVHATIPVPVLRWSGRLGADTVRLRIDPLTGLPKDGAHGQAPNRHPDQSFMKTLKVEAVYAMAFETFDDVAEHLPRFIEHTYNTRRLHSSLGYLSPTQFEDQLPRQTVKSTA